MTSYKSLQKNKSRIGQTFRKNLDFNFWPYRPALVSGIFKRGLKAEYKSCVC